jgi:hypothetical protein
MTLVSLKSGIDLILGSSEIAILGQNLLQLVRGGLRAEIGTPIN